MQSRFSSHTIAEIFRDLYLGERSGMLELSRADERKQIFFDRGLIHFAESNDEQGRLGAVLVAEGKLSAGALDEAQRNISHPRELALALVNRELIRRPAIQETVQQLVERTVQAAFSWEGGSASFSDSDNVSLGFECDVLSTFQVILRGIFSMPGFTPIQDALQSFDSRLRIKKPTPIPLERLKLSPTHGYVLSRVDGTTTVKEVLSLLPQAEEESTVKFLFGLLMLGVLELDPPLADGPLRVSSILRDHADAKALERLQEQTIRQAEAQMRKQSPYEVLGVKPTATLSQIESAYEQAKAMFAREQILPRTRERFRSQLALIESRLIEAYLTLSKPEQMERPREAPEGQQNAGTGVVTADDLLVRVEMDKTKSKLAIEEAGRVADSYYAKALTAQREGDFHNAIQYGKLAISYNQEDARFFFLVGECQARNPGARWQHMAEQNFTKATQLDPWNADYLLALGRFYKKRGLKIRAKKQFEEALKVAPSHTAAGEELESLR